MEHSYIHGVRDVLEIVEQELGLCTAGSEAEYAVARIYQRIHNELVVG
jgi:hypothetical protein